MIPNLVNTVKGAANFEQSTLTQLSQLRSQWQTAPNVNAKVDTANQIESTLSKILVMAENYPQLTATKNFSRFRMNCQTQRTRLLLKEDAIMKLSVISTQESRLSQATWLQAILDILTGLTFESVSGAENAPTVNFN